MSADAGVYEPVDVSESEGVLEVALDRPRARNAIDLVSARRIAAAMDRLDSRDDLGVGIISGRHGVFCSGMDMKAFLRGERPRVEGRGFAGLVERPPQKPLIAAVEGYALAGGFEIVLACDMVVAAEDATFGLPEAKRGLVAAGGGLMRLSRKVSAAIALEMAVTGDPISARRALDLGLVNRVVPAGQALETARDLARAVSANGPLAVRAAKRIITESRLWPADREFELQRRISEPVFASEDAREGAKAFAERRSPTWTGR